MKEEEIRKDILGIIEGFFLEREDYLSYVNAIHLAKEINKYFQELESKEKN